MKIKVTNCADCPFKNEDSEYGSSCKLIMRVNPAACLFPNPSNNLDLDENSFDSDEIKIIMPGWCPLMDEAAEVSFHSEMNVEFIK